MTMKMIRKMIDIKAKDDFTLECLMENGEHYIYDMSFLKEYKGGGPLIEELKDINYFKKVFLDYGHPTWPNGYDVDSAVVPMEGKLIGLRNTDEGISDIDLSDIDLTGIDVDKVI